MKKKMKSSKMLFVVALVLSTIVASDGMDFNRHAQQIPVDQPVTNNGSRRTAVVPQLIEPGSYDPTRPVVAVVSGPSGPFVMYASQNPSIHQSTFTAPVPAPRGVPGAAAGTVHVPSNAGSVWNPAGALVPATLHSHAARTSPVTGPASNPFGNRPPFAASVPPAREPALRDTVVARPAVGPTTIVWPAEKISYGHYLAIRSAITGSASIFGSPPMPTWVELQYRVYEMADFLMPPHVMTQAEAYALLASRDAAGVLCPDLPPALRNAFYYFTGSALFES